MSASGIPPGGSAAFQEALKKLAVEFEQSLPQRMASASELLRQCRERPLDGAPLEELHRMMHTMAGSAATFGRQQLGSLAREIEFMLAALQGEVSRTATSFDNVATRLDALREEAGVP